MMKIKKRMFLQLMINIKMILFLMKIRKFMYM
jgi:hypothetical protein